MVSPVKTAWNGIRLPAANFLSQRLRKKGIAPSLMQFAHLSNVSSVNRSHTNLTSRVEQISQPFRTRTNGHLLQFFDKGGKTAPFEEASGKEKQEHPKFQATKSLMVSCFSFLGGIMLLNGNNGHPDQQKKTITL